ncbi:MAG: hypothetical protein DYH15_01360 [Nitrosomonas sp. PRO4]|nr:hypothetical protein [Nitrosomonas sp. PRO4]
MKNLLTQMIYMLVILLIVYPVSSADEIVPINAINTSPVNFDGKEVRLKGIAKNPTRLPLIDLKSYMLEDTTGEIMVLTESDLPRMNEEFTVRVRIKSLAIINGEALGLTAIELERYEQQQEI